MDVTGEPSFFLDIIEKYQTEAESKKLYILPACGVGSLITDVAVETLKEDFTTHEESTVIQALGYVKYNGRYAKTFSNGTWNTLINSMASKPKRTQKKPVGERKKTVRVGTHFFKKIWNWAVPFVEGADLYSIRRTNELNKSSTGNAEFSYAQFTLLPLLPPLWLIWTLLTMLIIMFFSKINFVRKWLISQTIANGGPSKQQRQDSSVDVWILAKDSKGKSKNLHMHCPGPYDTTGIACAETALALTNERDSLKHVFGIVTPGAVMSKQLQKNLKERGGITWEITNDKN